VPRVGKIFGISKGREPRGRDERQADEGKGHVMNAGFRKAYWRGRGGRGCSRGKTPRLWEGVKGAGFTPGTVNLEGIKKEEIQLSGFGSPTVKFRGGRSFPLILPVGRVERDTQESEKRKRLGKESGRPAKPLNESVEADELVVLYLRMRAWLKGLINLVGEGAESTENLRTTTGVKFRTLRDPTNSWMSKDGVLWGKSLRKGKVF